MTARKYNETDPQDYEAVEGKYGQLPEGASEKERGVIASRSAPSSFGFMSKVGSRFPRWATFRSSVAKEAGST
jgi:hypothetical protein